MARIPQSRSLKTLERILVAAERLIARQGLNSLTMEAVAAEAGVSKGGVLHHFRSKEALIAGLVLRKTQIIRDETDREEQLVRDHPNHALLGIIRHFARQYGDEEGFPAALLVAATQNSQSLALIRSLMAEQLAKVGAVGERADEAGILVFAALGLLLSRALGFSTLGVEEGRRLLGTIERMAGRLD